MEHILLLGMRNLIGIDNFQPLEIVVDKVLVQAWVLFGVKPIQIRARELLGCLFQNCVLNISEEWEGNFQDITN